MRYILIILLLASGQVFSHEMDTLRGLTLPELNFIMSEDIPQFPLFDLTESDPNLLTPEIIRLDNLPAIDPKLPQISLYTVYYSPFYTNKQFTEGYRRSGGWDMGKSLFLTATARENVYYTVGFSRQVESGFMYAPNEWMVIYGGAYGVGYNVRNQQLSDIGLNTSMTVVVNDRIKLNFFGQISGYGAQNNNISNMPYNMFPQSHFGGTVELKITNKFSIQGGMMREYDTRSGSWRNNFIGGPLLY